MTNKALITRRAAADEADDGMTAGDAARGRGFAVEHDLSGGSIVSLDDEQEAGRLEASGFRVKILPDTNLLSVGTYQIDTEAASADTADEVVAPAPPVPA